MSAHTPGPWTLTTVKTSAGLCHKVGPFLWKDGKQNHACIYDDFPGVGGGTPELIANARLIAAAPDLLKACQQAIAAIKGREHTGFLEKAIAKATEITP